jgi:hypothetical protein
MVSTRAEFLSAHAKDNTTVLLTAVDCYLTDHPFHITL